MLYNSLQPNLDSPYLLALDSRCKGSMQRGPDVMQGPTKLTWGPREATR